LIKKFKIRVLENNNNPNFPPLYFWRGAGGEVNG